MQFQVGGERTGLVAVLESVTGAAREFAPQFTQLSSIFALGHPRQELEEPRSRGGHHITLLFDGLKFFGNNSALTVETGV